MQNFITSFSDFIPQNQRQNYKRRKKEIQVNFNLGNFDKNNKTKLED